ncbi:DUF4251 domain-containing protein [Algoriphagus sp. H41]|uniref:DUF4251 domain-containing protein n=1 Tax=Algoriphagus oliviformis TaxID=2811231 RepID=A0ABS3BY88_9BACT|nr:DUF4251 domain-containing protein [Algoriphagus oliviformis]MBN7809643.1 DUF4251 domain-containing protein [Algoriphagus oliviformis]
MKKPAFLFLFCLSIMAAASAQQTDPEKLQQAVDTKTFVFEGRQASGVRGRMIQLDPGYTLEVSPEKVTGNLPFFGRSYQGTPGSTDIGLKFDFSEFDYSVKPRKKGGWDITIEPKESSDVRSVFLTIQSKGNASLRVTSNSKEPMSYTGFIK